MTAIFSFDYNSMTRIIQSRTMNNQSIIRDCIVACHGTITFKLRTIIPLGKSVFSTLHKMSSLKITFTLRGVLSGRRRRGMLSVTPTTRQFSPVPIFSCSLTVKESISKMNMKFSLNFRVS